MPITVTRFGGPMVMKPKSKTFTLEDLDTPTREALGTLLQKAAPIGVQERLPDGFVYAFEVEEAGKSKKEVEVAGPHIPDALRKLLP